MNTLGALRFLLVLSVVTASSSLHASTIQVFTNRTSWENALAGRSIETESLDDFSGFTYETGGVPAFQFPAGVTQIGLLQFDVERPSGNLIVGGESPSSINGTTLWRIEAATQNGNTPPVTPALVFSHEIVGFGADYYFNSTPRSTISLNGSSLRFSDYLTSGTGFLGFVTSSPFTQVEFDVVSPFNTLFYADDISFASVPEPSSLALGVIAALLVAVRYRFNRANPGVIRDTP